MKEYKSMNQCIDDIDSSMILDEGGKERERENEHMATNKSMSSRRPSVCRTVKKWACIVLTGAMK